MTSLARIGARDGWRCTYCAIGLTAKTGSRDHVIPRSRGGATNEANLVLACVDCNSRKGDGPLWVFLASDWYAERVAAVASGRVVPLNRVRPPKHRAKVKRRRDRAVAPISRPRWVVPAQRTGASGWR